MIIEAIDITKTPRQSYNHANDATRMSVLLVMLCKEIISSYREFSEEDAA